MKRLLGALSKLFTALLLVSVSAAVILYVEGYYDFVFLPRNAVSASGTPTETDGAVTGTSQTLLPPEILPPATSAGPENVSQVTDPADVRSDETTGPSSSAPDASTYAYPSAAELESAGYARDNSEFIYGSHVLAEVVPDVEFPQDYSFRELKTTRQVYDDSAQKFGSENVTTVRPSLYPYMGWFIFDDGASLSLLDSTGKLVMTRFDGITPAYLRDEYARPLFRYRDGLYYVDQGSRSLVKSDYNESFTPGLRFDYNAGYGKSALGLYLYYIETTESYVANTKKIAYAEHYGRAVPEPEIVEEEVRLWGYMYANGTVAIEAQYHYAFNFNENGLAVVGNRDRQTWVINRSGRTVINVNNQILYPSERNRRPTHDGYYLPATDGIEQLGMFYFDHGLMRVRRMYTDYYDLEPVSETDILITDSGDRFDIPSGYELVWYSDGVLTLKKGDYYGCMDYTGKWIAQPIYTYAGPFREGLAVLGFAGGMKGMIDTKGNIVIPFIYDKISEVTDGTVTVWREGLGWRLLNKLSAK